jgi:hypothetical protein
MWQKLNKQVISRRRGQLLLSLVFLPVTIGTALAATDSNDNYGYRNLEGLLNQADKPSAWKQTFKTLAPYHHVPEQNSRAYYAFQHPGAQERTFHSFNPWGAQPASSGAASAYHCAPATGSGEVNPFNLSPFEVLHYLWDPTTYTSNSNPVTLTEVRDQLQIAQHYSALAQSAARRAKYACDPESRQTSAREAQAYAQQAQAAADRARELSESGSSNPAEVAALAGQEAQQARRAASQCAAPW